MSKRNRREHGRILSVETMARGDSLADDFAAGATSITVNDAGDFDEDGGWLYVGAQTVEYLECDDDTGVITLVDPLAAAAEQGDPVHVWSDLYGEVVDYQLALVELDGEYDNPDPVAAEVAEGVGELPEGDRGKAGESCTLLRIGEDEWEVVGVGGRPRQSQGTRWEQDDFYVLTAADITAGVAVAPLSKRPNDEALTCVLAGAPQRPTSWTIDYNAQTLTVPLSGWERASDVLWVHYAYRKNVTAAGVSLSELVLVGANWKQDVNTTSLALPAGTAADDLIVVAAVGDTVAMSDPRMTQRLDAGGDLDGKLWTGIADGSGAAIGVSATAGSSFVYSSLAVAVFRGPVAALTVVAEAGAAGKSVEAMDASSVVVASFSGYSVTNGAATVSGGFTVAVQAPPAGNGKTGAMIAYWNGAKPSPVGTWTGTGGFLDSRFGAMVVGVS